MGNPLHSGIHNIHQLADDIETRSISPENFTGEKGKGGMATKGTGEGPAHDLGQGWKVSPFVRIEPGQTFTFHGFRFQVLRKSRNRITALRITPLQRKPVPLAKAG